MEQLSTVTSAFSIITGLIDVVNKIKNDDGTVEKLNLAIIEAWKVLDMAVDSQLQGNNCRAFEDQAKTLIRWCYDAEDILDARKIASPRKRDAVVKFFKDIPNSLFNIDKNGKLLKDLNEIVTQWKNILTQGTHQKTTTDQCDGTLGPYMSKPLIGREDDIEKIVELLSCDSNNGTAIIGMCGLGKTSLAQTIFYNDKGIVNRFCCRSWVNVRDGVFVWDTIKKEIDEDLRKCDSAAGNKHRKNLLVVFDNLLSVKHTEWHKFCIYKKELENKSIYVRIIITTHNLRIPEKTDTTRYYLQPLPNVCCEEVIKENAKLYNIDLTDPSFLNDVKSMAEQCEGLPLFAEWFGIVIAKRNDDDQRVAIRKRRKLWHMTEFEFEILPRLLPSYTNMKSEMRRCLAYFSLFPFDHQFNIDDLIHLFVGECFLQLYEATSNLKQIGEKCVHDLKERSILQPVLSTEPLYKLQSFGQEFAKKAALGTCLHQLDQGELSILSSSRYDIRHLSISWKEFNSESWSQLEKLRKLRTFLLLYAETCIGQLGEEVPSSLYKAVSCARVISLKRTDVKYLPKFIYRLKHLRYLDISYTSVTQLPETFPKLYALQFLKIKNTKLSHLPKKFYKLTNLRYIDWEEDDMRKLRMPRHIGKLFALESLPLFDIGEKEGYSIGELRDMKNLQGSICIENLQVVANAESQKAMLHEKCYLTSIVLKWKPRSIRDFACDEDILKGLQPHENVRELKIINYGGDNLPEWITNSMIEKVYLMACRSCYLPALAKMKNLKTLVLEDMEGITQVRCRSDNDADAAVCFPQLESLKFDNMTQLNEWTSGLQEQDMPHLHELKFINCPNLNPSLPDDLLQRLKNMSIEF